MEVSLLPTFNQIGIVVVWLEILLLCANIRRIFWQLHFNVRSAKLFSIHKSGLVSLHTCLVLIFVALKTTHVVGLRACIHGSIYSAKLDFVS